MSKELATIYGDPEILKGYGSRNTILMAIAPTTSSSAILEQTSPGIEPFSSNYYKAGLAKGNFIHKNKYLKELLEEKDLDNEDTWRSIMLNHGCVQHLEAAGSCTPEIYRPGTESEPEHSCRSCCKRSE